jgi:hypothetical protein
MKIVSFASIIAPVFGANIQECGTICKDVHPWGSVQRVCAEGCEEMKKSHDETDCKTKAPNVHNSYFKKGCELTGAALPATNAPTGAPTVKSPFGDCFNACQGVHPWGSVKSVCIDGCTEMGKSHDETDCKTKAPNVHNSYFKKGCEFMGAALPATNAPTGAPTVRTKWSDCYNFCQGVHPWPAVKSDCVDGCTKMKELGCGSDEGLVTCKNEAHGHAGYFRQGCDFMANLCPAEEIDGCTAQPKDMVPLGPSNTFVNRAQFSGFGNDLTRCAEHCKQDSKMLAFGLLNGDCWCYSTDTTTAIYNGSRKYGGESSIKGFTFKATGFIGYSCTNPIFASDKCDPKECDNWTCKNWCKCFKTHPEIIELFEGPNPSADEQAIRNSCPSDNDECDCTEFHFGNAKKE